MIKMLSKIEALKRIVGDPQKLFGIIFVVMFVFAGLVIISVGFEAVYVPSSCSDEPLPCWAFATIFFVVGGGFILLSILFWIIEVWPYIMEGLK